MGDAAARILLVEDDDLVRSLVGMQLQALGYDVLVAGDAAGALATLAREAPPDLLMTDLSLPGGIDGYELALRAHAQQPALPILFVSGGDLPEPDGATPRWNAGYLGKPFRIPDLAAAIRGLLEGVRVGTPA